MNRKQRSNQPGAPKNPELGALVQAKQVWSSFAHSENIQPGFRGWHERGYLPHRDEPGLVQFVTFRLADSLPESVRLEWDHIREKKERAESFEEWENDLDAGRGTCHLSRPEIAEIVALALRFHDGDRYSLRAWVIIPNHVHALIQVWDVALSTILESWKKHTATTANRLLQRKGPFWQRDYFDTYMRDSDHERETRRYIENNPVKTGLVAEPTHWRWSSARNAASEESSQAQIGESHHKP